MAHFTQSAQQLIGSRPRATRGLLRPMVGLGALAVLSAAMALFIARPIPASVAAPAVPGDVIDGWQLSAPRGVGTAGGDVIDGWQLSAPRGVGSAH